jgi:hypothetical protein
MKNISNNKLNIRRCPPSPRVLCRNYSEAKAINNQLNPWFVTGFSDGEGSFGIRITQNKTYLIGWRVQPCFEIGLHQKDISLLREIQLFFGVGQIYVYGSMAYYKVTSIKDLAVIIYHFDKYSLITQKRADYLLFKFIVELCTQKEHLTRDGLHKIVSIRATMNKGLSNELKAGFSNVIPVPRPIFAEQQIKDPNWLAGFVSGEGCFMIKVIKSSSNFVGCQVKLVFQITQHSRDTQLMKSLVEY